MTNLYVVVGEHGDNPDQFLVLGEDGNYYAWDVSAEQTRPVEPGDEWRIDGDLPRPDADFEEIFIDP